MNMVNGYQSYRNSFYDNTVRNSNMQNDSAQETAKPDVTMRAEQPVKTETKLQLSQEAQDLLKELRHKYGNMDIMAADYSTEEEAKSYLSRGTKEFSVLINVDELEKLAASENGKETLISRIDSSVAKLQDMKEQLGEDGEEVKTLGVSFGKDGSASYFAELEKSSEAQRQRIEKARSDRRAEKKEQEKKAGEKRSEDKRTESEDGGRRSEAASENVKRTTVKADSVEELLKQIREVDWDSIPAVGQTTGSRFDFTV